MLFSLVVLKHYLDTDTALEVSQFVYCFTTSISHGVENYFPRLWGTGISDAIFSYDKDIWIAATDCYMDFYIIVLFSLTAILQLINFTALYF